MKAEQRPWSVRHERQTGMRACRGLLGESV
jgi:hypothetical protein